MIWQYYHPPTTASNAGNIIPEISRNCSWLVAAAAKFHRHWLLMMMLWQGCVYLTICWWLYIVSIIFQFAVMEYVVSKKNSFWQVISLVRRSHLLMVGKLWGHKLSCRWVWLIKDVIFYDLLPLMPLIGDRWWFCSLELLCGWNISQWFKKSKKC